MRNKDIKDVVDKVTQVAYNPVTGGVTIYTDESEED